MGLRNIFTAVFSDDTEEGTEEQIKEIRTQIEMKITQIKDFLANTELSYSDLDDIDSILADITENYVNE